MAAKQLGKVVRHIRRLAGSARLAEPTDAELLRRFAAHADETAFALLVQRHRGLVMTVCRNVLRQEQDAEDAFQATFLILARKVASIRERECIASWLHGVAYRTAGNARRHGMRRRKYEMQSRVSEGLSPLSEASFREWQAILDEEVRRLPEKYRAPFVLCCLEGKGREEAARELGWKEGTLSSRLSQGRNLLRDRLTRRGLTLSALLGAKALSAEAAMGGASAGLVAATTHAACRFAKSEAAEAISGPVAALVKSALREMSISAINVWTRVFLALVLVTAGVGLTIHQALAEKRAGAAAEALPTPMARNGSQSTATTDRPVGTDSYGDPLPSGAKARLGTVRLRPGNGLRLLTSSPDGRTVSSVADAENGLTITQWDWKTGKPLHRYEGPAFKVARAVDLSPDAKILAVAGYVRETMQNRTTLWDLSTGAELRSLGFNEHRAQMVSFAPDGKTLVTFCDDHTAHLWDVTTGVERTSFTTGLNDGACIAFSPNGLTLALAGSDGKMELWDVLRGSRKFDFQAHPCRVSAMVFSPDGSRLATAGQTDTKIRLWEGANGKEVRHFDAVGGSSSLAFSFDGKMLASGDARKDGQILENRPVRLWDVATGREIRRLPGHLFGVDALAFSRDNRKLISGGVGVPLRICDITNGKELLSFPEHGGYVNSVAFSPDGKSIATAGIEGAIRLWQTSTGKPIRWFAEGHRQRVWSVDFAPDGKSLASAGHDKSIRIWDPSTGQEIHKWNTFSGTGVAYSPDGHMIAAGDNGGEVTFHDAVTGKRLLSESNMRGYLNPRPFSPDGKMLVSVEGDPPQVLGIVHIWDTRTGKELRKWVGADACFGNFSPDGNTLAWVEDFRHIRLLNLGSGKERRIELPAGARTFSMAFSPDGWIVAWGDSRGLVGVAEVATGQIRRLLKGHLSHVRCLAFSPDGKILASGSSDSTVLLWDVSGSPPAGKGSTATAQEMKAWWADLALDDAARAYQSMEKLIACPAHTVSFLREQLKPVAGVHRQRVLELIADLDSKQYALRKKATEELEKLGEPALPMLRQALDKAPPLEMRQRLQRLIEKQEVPFSSSEELRSLRSVEALEKIGTKEAKQVLQTVANGAPGTRLTHEAKESLKRLER